MKAALLGAMGAMLLLGVLHRGVPVPETNLASILFFYGAMALLGALLATLSDRLARPPADGTPTRPLLRTAGVGLRNGLLLGAAYSLFRLLISFAEQECPLWFLALYSTAVTLFFGLGLSLLATLMAYWQTRGVK
jgi:hypothetical protein